MNNKVYISRIDQKQFSLPSDIILKALNLEPFYLYKIDRNYSYLCREGHTTYSINTPESWITEDIEEAKTLLHPIKHRWLTAYKSFYRKPVLEIEQRARLYTNTNYFGIYGSDEMRGLRSEVECMALTRHECIKFVVYIPTYYLYNYGYKEKDLIDWLGFLEEAGLCRNYKYVGKVDNPGFNSNFHMSESNNEGSFVYRLFANKKFFCVELDCSENSAEFNYCQFMAIRYIYNHLYHTIPRDAMKIKSLLGKEVSHQQAFIMAHLREKFYYYYSYFQENMIPDINQDLVSRIENADGDSINNCFIYLNKNTEFVTSLRELYKREDFSTILKILKDESRR